MYVDIDAYHRGIMAGRTPNIDTLAAEGWIIVEMKNDWKFVFP